MNRERQTDYPGIPRIDAHAHIGSDQGAIANYLRLRDIMQETHHADMALWINLGGGRERIADPQAVTDAAGGRMASCISDYSAQTGLTYAPEELPQWMKRGFIGYKIWSGPPHRKLKEGQKGYPYIDDPAHEATFARMEEAGIVAASIHIADPNGPYGDRHEWLPDPVAYWRNITAWRHVLERHPKLEAVTAHMCWLCCQDAQLDYLRNMLATFPGLDIDLAATFQYYYLVDRENLRSFMIEYADRILFGTDIGRWDAGDEDTTRQRVQRYFQCFQILEIDGMAPGGFFGQNPVRGLALPKDVLEKIYFRNAVRRYPEVGMLMQRLGYEILMP